jgi:nitrite reductase (NADH) small subunit
MATEAAEANRIVVCRRDDVPRGGMRCFTIHNNVPVLVARTDDDRYFAVRNTCPHHGASLARGYLFGTNLPSGVGEYRYGRHQEIVRCPWHGWEFDLHDGRSLHDPQGKRVKAYVVVLDGDHVSIEG